MINVPHHLGFWLAALLAMVAVPRTLLADSNQKIDGWAIVCEDRASADAQRLKLETFRAANHMPTVKEAITDGCAWAMVTLHLPIGDTDLPTMKSPDPSKSEEIRFYRCDVTFQNGPFQGQTWHNAYVQLTIGSATSLKKRNK